VGKDQERYVVHEYLLAQYSKFFRAALTGGFKEAVDKVIKLEDSKPEVFEFFIHWLYYQRFPNNSAVDDKDVVRRWTHEEAEQCIYLHIFGDKFEIEKLLLDTISEIVRLGPILRASAYPRADSVEAAFCDLPDNSPMCQLIIDYHCRYNDAEDVEHLTEFKCIPFLHGMWVKLNEMEDYHNVLAKDLDVCDYQGHASKKERKKCKSQE
jgi:hypothetical protein